VTSAWGEVVTRRTRLKDREAAVRIIEILRGRGFEAYLAGGCVRDELLGEKPKDYDVATSAHPEDIGSMFERTASVGASFGVMLVRDFGATIEVATFRADGPYGDSRRPDHVEFSTADQDAQRRDFTINALFLDPFGEDGEEVIDYVDGLKDLDAMVLRAVGDPEDRLAEDHLRALRGVRFASRYGLTMEEGTRDAIFEHAAELEGVSVERIGDEVKRMMGHGKSRHRAATLMHELELDHAIFGEAVGAHALPVLKRLGARAHAMTGVAAWALDRLGDGVLDEASAYATGWRGALDMSNDESTHFAKVLGFVGRVVREWDTMSVAQRKRVASSAHEGEGRKLLRAYSAKDTKRYIADVEALSGDGIGVAPEAWIGGDELISMGLTPGPSFKRVIDEVYDAQLEGRVSSMEEACNLARELFVNPA